MKALIEKKGVDIDYGARPLRRAIQNVLEDVIAEFILDGVILPNKKVELTVTDEKVVVKN